MNVPGSDIHPRVAPFYGEQPWMGAPRRSLPFSEWSMMMIISETQWSMMIIVSGTQILSLMDLCTCILKWNCFQWVVNI